MSKYVIKIGWIYFAESNNFFKFAWKIEKEKEKEKMLIDILHKQVKKQSILACLMGEVSIK